MLQEIEKLNPEMRLFYDNYQASLKWAAGMEYAVVDIELIAAQSGINLNEFIEALGVNQDEFKLITSNMTVGEIWHSGHMYPSFIYHDSQVREQVTALLYGRFEGINIREVDNADDYLIMFMNDEAKQLQQLLADLQNDDEEEPADTPDEATVAAAWREAGEVDPHGDYYDCERAKLCMGHLTDDELASGVYLNGDKQLTPQRLIAGETSSMVWLTAAKERIRWLSRNLVSAIQGKMPEGMVAATLIPTASQYDDPLVRLIVRWMGYDKPTIIKLRQIVMKESVGGVPDWMEHILTPSCDQWSEIASYNLRATLLYRAMQEPLKLPVIDQNI